MVLDHHEQRDKQHILNVLKSDNASHLSADNISLPVLPPGVVIDILVIHEMNSIVS